MPLSKEKKISYAEKMKVIVNTNFFYQFDY
jgi:hypothetical protein